MTVTASDLKHLYIHRRTGQTIVFEVGDTKFVISVGRMDPIRRNVTLDIMAGKEVRILRGELLVGDDE